MAKGDEKEVKPGKKVEVDESFLIKLQEDMAELQGQVQDVQGKNEVLEGMMSEAGKSPEGEKGLRQRQTYEPKFRTVRIRKYPIAGDPENLGYVIGWTNRGAYNEVDRTGVSPQVVPMIDIIFLGREKNKEGKILAEKVPLHKLLSESVQVTARILDTKFDKKFQPTGEEIDVTLWDPNHGLVSTGDKVDGFVTYSDIKYLIQIPAIEEPVWIDHAFCN